MSFVVVSILNITFVVLAIIFTIIAIVKKEYKIFSGLAAIISLILMFITYININVPTPTIYPLDNEVRVYEGNAEVTIDSNASNPLIHTYYTLDGSDPKDGDIYKGTFIITKSTTVSAKNKFLWRWSEPSKNTYRFENIQNTYVSATNDSQMPLEEIFAYILTFFIMASICISLIRR